MDDWILRIPLPRDKAKKAELLLLHPVAARPGPPRGL